MFPSVSQEPTRTPPVDVRIPVNGISMTLDGVDMWNGRTQRKWRDLVEHAVEEWVEDNVDGARRVDVDVRGIGASISS